MHVEYLEFTHIVIFPGNSPPLSVLSMSASNDWGLVHVLRSAQPIRAQDCVTPANGRTAADISLYSKKQSSRQKPVCTQGA